ncbi:iron complex transport system substrate-binding protein [Rhodoligotrophos appendicifer]|uniref:ABC transporter substrate-binding protein n=1 Tax=Rhodoligotrophos appendicifer TaxID=987056 RepID=UPI00195FCA25|nr:ABC transporter substrate-binding protein [Rhodoligotrophos appendicifer]
MNMCADELVLRIADPRQIVSVTSLAQDPASANLAAPAALFPANRGLAEEVIALRPDLVVAGRYTTRTTVAQLHRSGIAVMELDVPSSFAETEAQIRRLGHVLGQGARAEQVIAQMTDRLNALKPPAESGPTAIVYQPNGFAAGKGSLIDALLARAGLRNLAAEHNLEQYGAVPLEKIVSMQPDILIMNAEAHDPALALEILRHPVLKAAPTLRVVNIPTRLWTCAGPEMVEAVTLLATAARQVQSDRRR